MGKGKGKTKGKAVESGLLYQAASCKCSTPRGTRAPEAPKAHIHMQISLSFDGTYPLVEISMLT